jgi:hypothetical protein
MQGFFIEDGEAEGLVADLTARWCRPPSVPAAADRVVLSTAAGHRFLPLRHAVRQFDLCSVEYDVLALALAIELDAAFGRLVAYLNDHVGRTRSTLGLILGLRSPDLAPLSPLGFCVRPVVRDGVVCVTEGHAYVALNLASGAERWRLDVTELGRHITIMRGERPGATLRHAIVAGDRAFVGVTGGLLVALELADGTPR